MSEQPFKIAQSPLLWGPRLPPGLHHDLLPSPEGPTATHLAARTSDATLRRLLRHATPNLGHRPPPPLLLPIRQLIIGGPANACPVCCAGTPSGKCDLFDLCV